MSFGISNNVRSREVRTCTPELFWKAVRSDYVAMVCAGIADAWEQWKRGELTKEEYEEVKNREKKRLPIFTFHATFPGGRRLNADAQPTGLSMYDIDHLNAPREYYAHMVEERKEELGIVLAHVTPSREGLRLVFIIPAGMDLAGAQRWMSHMEREAARNEVTQFSSSGEVALPRETGEHGGGEYPKGEVVATNTNATTQDKSVSVSAATTPAVGHPSSPEEGNLDTFKGIPYSEIIKQWFTLAGGEPTTGERNSKLHRLAYHLRHITDNDESLLLKIMPRYGLPEEEMKGLIHSACNAAWCGMPRMMQEAIDRNRRDAIHRVSSTENAARESGDAMNRVSTPPEMPEKLPPLIKLLVSRTPDIYKPAVAHAVFPSLAAHLHRVRFRYIDNVEHEATLMNVLMAGTGAGKDCISEPINRIMADIRGLHLRTHQPHHGGHPRTRRTQPGA